MIRIAALVAAALTFTAASATVADARVTYGMRGNGTYTGEGTADCGDGTNVSFTCDGIAGQSPFTSGNFQSDPDSAGMQCAESACASHGGVVLSSIAFVIEDGWWNAEAEETQAVQERFEPAPR